MREESKEFFTATGESIRCQREALRTRADEGALCVAAAVRTPVLLHTLVQVCG